MTVFTSSSTSENGNKWIGNWVRYDRAMLTFLTIFFPFCDKKKENKDLEMPGRWL